MTSNFKVMHYSVCSVILEVTARHLREDGIIIKRNFGLELPSINFCSVKRYIFAVDQSKRYVNQMSFNPNLRITF